MKEGFLSRTDSFCGYIVFGGALLDFIAVCNEKVNGWVFGYNLQGADDLGLNLLNVAGRFFLKH